MLGGQPIHFSKGGHGPLASFEGFQVLELKYSFMKQN